MSRPDQYLRTQQVADALGISVSTLKRWVDAGEIEATRTVGRHRLISLAEAIRFAHRRRLSTVALNGLAESGNSTPIVADDRMKDLLYESLKAGRAREARRLIATSHAALGSGAALADELIGPVLARIGHGWSVGAWDVFQEHQASQIVATALVGLIAGSGLGGDSPAPVAVGASPEGDHYTISGLLAELTLREIGWDVRNLGPNLPLASLARGVEAQRPRLVYLAVGHLADPIGFVDAYAKFHRTARASGSSVILGGRGLPADLLDKLPSEGHGNRMAELADFGRRLLHAPEHPDDATPGRNGPAAPTTN